MNLIKKIFSRRNIVAAVLMFCLSQIITPDLIFAQTTNAQSDTLKGIAEVSGVLINVLTFIALLMMNFFGELLGTDLLTGPDAMQAITPMWVWVRNLTNILFVAVLVGLAFSNLYSSFGSEGGGNWSIKEKLPKIIIALVAINFSLLGFKVVIDVVNVGTVAILGIADSRLDADNSDLQGAMLKSKTWFPVTDTVWDNLDDDGKIAKDKVDSSSVTSGDTCTVVHDQKRTNNDIDEGQVLGVIKGDKKYICRDFRSTINDLFCPNWLDSDITDNDDPQKDVKQENLDDDCLFLLKNESFSTILSPSDEPGQNLFMSFGTTFIHLERLPALGAEINSLNGVIMNSLFSAILGLAYLVALVAVFIALLARVIVIWMALVFSPVIIAGYIMGFDDQIGDASKQLVTHLIMPLKIAAAFAVSFVMMSAMIDFNVVGKNDSFLFGPALSNLGVAEYGFMWQIATIVVFWMAAKWAVDGSLAKNITEKIFSGAETLGETAARAATVDRQIFAVGTGKNDQKFSMSNLMKMPAALEQAQSNANLQGMKNMKEALGIMSSDFENKIESESFNSGEGERLLNLSKGADTRQEYDNHKNDVLKKLSLGTSAFSVAMTEFAKLDENKNKTMSEISRDFALSTEGKRFFETGDAEKFMESSHYTGTAGTSAAPKGGADKVAAKDVVEKDDKDNTTVAEQKLSELESSGNWTSKGNAILLSATNYGEIAEKEDKKDDENYLGDLFKKSTMAKEPVKIVTEKTDNIATINTSESDKTKGIVSIAESKNGAIKVTAVSQNGKTPVDLTSLGAKSDGTISIDNTFVTNLKNKYFENDGNVKQSLSETDADILKTFKSLEENKFISNNSASGLSEEDKSFIENLSNVTLPGPTSVE